MAVHNDFSGPVPVSGRTLAATITGLDYAKFKVRMTVKPRNQRGSAEYDFQVDYTDPVTGSQGFGDVDTARYYHGEDITAEYAYDLTRYKDCTIRIYVTGSLLDVTDVRVDGYQRRYFPDASAGISGSGITFNIERLVPRFLMADKNGYALAKAIERCFQIVAEAVQTGIDIIKDPAKMPEWRLDELAGELGCLYDYNGSIDQKRYWITNATYLYSVYGTPQAIYNFLEGYFNNVLVEEAWEYNGSPFHFRVTVSDASYNAEKIAWAQKAIMAVKNVRSVLDSVTIDSSSEIVVTADAEYFYVPYFFDTDEISSGNGIEEWVEESVADVARTDEALTDEGVTG